MDGRELDLQTQVLLRLMELEKFPALNELSVAEARDLYRTRAGTLAGSAPVLEKTIDRSIEGPRGLIPIRVYSPRPVPTKEPVVIYYHGGGWVIGDLQTHDPLCRTLADQARCIVVAVDYRRAPESKFPAAVDDARAAYRWLIDHADEIGADASRVAVAGDSAGGNLAAVVPALARDAGWPMPIFQMLMYPVTDLRIRSRSHEVFERGFFLTGDMMRWFRGHYLSTEAEQRDPRASPLLLENLNGLPPAFVATAGFDPLRDEGREYAERLRQSGVAVTYRCYDGLIHGFASFTGAVSAARVAVAEAVASLQWAFQRKQAFSA